MDDRIMEEEEEEGRGHTKEAHDLFSPSDRNFDKQKLSLPMPKNIELFDDYSISPADVL